MPTADSGVTLPTGFYSPIPKERVAALREAAPAFREQLMSGLSCWPRKSPGSLNAWCVFLGPSPGVSGGPCWPYDPLPSVGGAHPGISEFKDTKGFWENGIRPYAHAIFPELNSDDAYAAVMVRNLVKDQSAEAPKDRERMREGALRAIDALNKLIRPRLVVAFRDAGKYTTRLIEDMPGSTDFEAGSLYSSRAAREHRWRSIRGVWESGEEYLYVHTVGIHPSRPQVRGEDRLKFLWRQSKSARSL